MQNQLGETHFTIPSTFAEQVREAFRKSLPTQAMRERRLKEGRGFGDKDGGGGVYKGKKKNRIEDILRAEDCITAQSAAKQAPPLSFVFVFPGWSESQAFQQLDKSLYLTSKVLIAASEHGYVSGAQHQRKDRYLDAPYDTAVFVLQNSAGRNKWPIKRKVKRRRDDS